MSGPNLWRPTVHFRWREYKAYCGQGDYERRQDLQQLWEERVIHFGEVDITYAPVKTEWRNVEIVVE